MRLIYVNQVDFTEKTGQGTHEKEIKRLLINDKSIEGIYVGQKPDKNHNLTNQTNIFLIPIKKNIFGYIAYQFRLFRILLRLIKQKDTIIFQRYSPTMLAPALISRLFKIPLITRTGPTIRNLKIYEKPNNHIFRFLLNILIRFNYHSSSYIVTVTKTVEDYVKEKYSMDAEKMKIIGNGFNPNTFFLKKNDSHSSDNQNDPLLVFAGSFHIDTGVDDLAKALSILSKKNEKQQLCILAGDGPTRSDIEKNMSKLDLNWRIIFPGRIEQKKLNDYLNRATLAVVPFNSMGLNQTGSAAVKVYEYLATGTPVLATRHDDHKFIEENNLGILCNPDDPEDMAEGILKIIDLSKNKNFDKERLADYAKQNGLWNNSYQKIKDLCKSALLGNIDDH